MNLRKRLADNLFAIRKNLGISQKELSKISKINITYIGYIENSQVAASIDVIEKIAKALDTDPCLLLARNTIIIPRAKSRRLRLVPTLLKKGEAAFAF